MSGRILAVLLLCLPVAAQERFRIPTFPPDIISHDTLIRDLALLDAKHARVDAENSQVRVLRINMEAGEALPMHDSRDGVLVCLTACRLSVTNPAGITRDIKLEAGQTLWMSAERHKIANRWTTVEMLYIEAKRPES